MEATDGKKVVRTFNGNNIRRSDFDDDFVFGAATAAFQTEGAAAEDGRGPSIWDTFTRRTPGKIGDGGNVNVAVDTYHRYKEDVKIMKKMGLDAYCFSISWSRILPGGRISAGVNQKGIEFYNNLIDELLANGIQPFAKFLHFDLPQALEDEYMGFLSPQIAKDFGEFADLCFWEFGDRVKHWITLNEPWTYAVAGYVNGVFPPGRGATTPELANFAVVPHKFSPRPPSVCENGDPGREPYLVAHNMLLAHAEAVDIYRRKYKAQDGKIGITLVGQWFKPLNDTEIDQRAADRALDFMFDWFMGPIHFGRYPVNMTVRVGDRLPSFSDQDRTKLIGSYDFLGLNYYTSIYATDDPSTPTGPPSYTTDQRVKLQEKDKDGKPIGPQLTSSWISVYPKGLYELLGKIRDRYGDIEIYITENGLDERNDPKLTAVEACKDDQRTKYIQDHLDAIRWAMHDFRVNVRGYFAWSLLDNFELTEGYTSRFGLIYVNYKDELARHPKDSAKWYMNFLKGKDAAIKLQQKAKSLINLPSKRSVEEVASDFSNGIDQVETPAKKSLKRGP